MNKENGQSNGAVEEWELAPAPESTGHVKLESSYDLFIGGKFVKSAKGERFKTINPATESAIAEITDATSADVDKAVKAARTAYDKHWSKISAAQRGKYLSLIHI